MTAVVAFVALIAVIASLPLGHFLYPPRRRAVRAEQAARPHSVHAATAAQDAAAILTARIREDEQAFRDLHNLTPAKPVDTITVKGTYL